jgi:hypothetical protein
MEHIKLVYLSDQRREIRAADFFSEIVGWTSRAGGCPWMLPANRALGSPEQAER